MEQAESNGIGLALAQQLAKALGGSIEAESIKDKGSTFSFEFPIQRNEKQLHSYWRPIKETSNITEEGKSIKEDTTAHPDKSNQNLPGPTLLLAEDNKDIAFYIRSIFHDSKYTILYATNGEEAFKLINEHIPDIVVTDVLMPKMNGIDLCKKIKASPLLNHIPIIIISAKNRDEDLLEGLKCGADSFIKKPFLPEELRVRVENLLSSRNLLKEKYRRTVFKPEKLAKEEESFDTDFLRHVTDIIYREMKNPNFTSGKLARELALSVSQLNKKLNATAGYPSSTYIRQVKLNHAKKILATRNKTIGEVATECGIYDVNYFSRVFKKETGVTPTQFKHLPNV